MPSTFRLRGDYSTTPSTGSPSGRPDVHSPIDEVLGIAKKAIQDIVLTADAPSVVNLSGLTNIHVLVVKAWGGKVRVRITTADGATQAVPVDSFFVLTCLSVPITAIDLTRVAGVEVTVSLFMGERV